MMRNHQGLIVPLLACVGLLVITLILAAWRSGLQEAEQRDTLLTESLSLASTLNAQGLSARHFRNGQPHGADFERISRHLDHLAHLAGYQNLWTVARIDQHLLPGPGGSPNRTPGAQVSQTVAQVLKTGQAHLTEVYQGASGAVISALAPVSVDAKGQGQIVVGIDIAAAHWRTPLLHAAAAPLVPGALLVLIFIVVAWQLRRRDLAIPEVQSQLKFLEPVLAAITGLVVTFIATSSTIALEQHFDAQLNRLATFLDPQTLAVAPHPATPHLPLSASIATALIGVILTCVATTLVVWLRGRLGQVEQLLDQRNRQLQQREANFDAITNAVRDAIIMMNSQGKIVYWNPAAEQLFGYRETEALNQDLHTLIAGKQARHAYHQGLENFASQGIGRAMGRQLELEGFHKDGSPIPLEISLAALRLDHEWHALGVIRDIAARKRTEQRLIKLNQCLAHMDADYRRNINRITAVCGEIFNADAALYNRLEQNRLLALGRWQTPDDLPMSSLPQGHICYDLIQGKTASPSKACEKTRNCYFLSDLNQTPYPRTDPTVNQYGLKAYFGHAVRLNQESVGSLCVLFNNPRSPSDEEQRLLGILAAALTSEENRHHASLELERSEKRMSLATRTTGIGIWEYQPVSHQLRLDSAMHSLLDLHPLRPERALDDWLKRLMPEDIAPLQEALDHLNVEGCEIDHELRLLDPSGGMRYLRVLGSTHRAVEHQEIYVLGVCYDITRRKAFETHLREAKDMAEQASQAKTQFLSQVSHELRTPMNAVLGFAQLLDADPELNPDQQESVNEILNSGQHLLKLIDEVLDLARIESGEVDLELAPVPLAPLVEESLILIKPMVAEQALQLDFIPPGDLTVTADAYRCQQVLLKLLFNAVQYNRPGGSIRVEARRMPALPKQMERARIQVTDTGHGIAEHQLKEIFEPFRRLPDGQVHGITGSGVGLAVVKRLVLLMDGDIGVDSTPGEGSCFWFELPCPAQSPPGSPLQQQV